MEAFAKLLTAIAAVIGALAWPTAIVIVILSFKRELKGALAKMPAVIDRVKALKLGAIEAELDKVVEQSANQDLASGTVSDAEFEAAAKIAIDSAAIGETALAIQLDKLCIEYDTIRRVMPAGYRRTQAMTRAFVRMRALGPAVSDRIDAYKSSGSAGSRLAAIAMMQMEPHKADLPWLVSRFRNDHPFIFYHAALAMQNAANDSTIDRLDAIKSAASESLSILNSFKGEPDKNTIQVLEALISN
jgi:hypothetical protein